MRKNSFVFLTGLMGLVLSANPALAASLPQDVTITLPNGVPYTYPGNESPIINFDPVTGIVRITSPVNPNYARVFGTSTGSTGTSGGFFDNPADFDNGFGNPGVPTSSAGPISPPPFDGCSGFNCGTPTGPSTAVPEPEMAGMFLFGLAGLVAARRLRRFRRKS